MASRDKPSKGYFSLLNVISSADANFFFEPKRRNKNGGKRSCYWDVERLVERRERNGTVSMFRSACFCTCKLEVMYFNEINFYPKLARTEFSPFHSIR